MCVVACCLQTTLEARPTSRLGQRPLTDPGIHSHGRSIDSFGAIESGLTGSAIYSRDAEVHHEVGLRALKPQQTTILFRRHGMHLTMGDQWEMVWERRKPPSYRAVHDSTVCTSFIVGQTLSHRDRWRSIFANRVLIRVARPKTSFKTKVLIRC